MRKPKVIVAESVAKPASAALPVLPDIGKPVMAKAVARVPDINWLLTLGLALAYAVAVSGWTNKEAAREVGTDDAEFGKWLSGNRRTQVDKVLAVEQLRWHFIVGLAKHSGEGEIVTTIRRTA